MYYENVSLIDTIYPPKQEVRFSQHAVYQAPLVSNVEVSKITNVIVLTKEEHDFVDDEVKATGLIQKVSEVLQIEDSIFEEFKEVVDHIDFFFLPNSVL